MPSLNKSTRKPWIVSSPANAKRSHKTNASFSSDEDAAFYNQSKWRKLSRQYRQDNPLCRMCMDEGYTTQTNVTDHVKPKRLWPELAFDINNFQPLCHKHHNKKSAIERRITTKSDFYRVSNGKHKRYYHILKKT